MSGSRLSCCASSLYESRHFGLGRFLPVVGLRLRAGWAVRALLVEPDSIDKATGLNGVAAYLAGLAPWLGAA